MIKINVERYSENNFYESFLVNFRKEFVFKFVLIKCADALVATLRKMGVTIHP